MWWPYPVEPPRDNELVLVCALVHVHAQDAVPMPRQHTPHIPAPPSQAGKEGAGATQTAAAVPPRTPTFTTTDTQTISTLLHCRGQRVASGVNDG